MKKLIARVAIVVAVVAGLSAIGGPAASADKLCVRAVVSTVDATSCVPLI